MKIDGGCLCGAITYQAEVDPARAAICHCTDCQVNSGSAFGIVIGVKGGQFRLLTGTLKEYVKTAESGNRRILSFCPDCGTRIHARADNDPDAFFGLRLGTVRQRAELPPKTQVWCRSALAWVDDIAGIPRRDRQG